MAEMDSVTSGGLRPLWDDYLMAGYMGTLAQQNSRVQSIAMPALRDLPSLYLSDVFVAPLLAERAVDPETEPETWPAGLDVLAALEQNPRLVVLGDPGGGKTVLTSWLAWHLASRSPDKLPVWLHNRVPLLCVLRDMPAEVFAATTDMAALAQMLAERLAIPDWNDDCRARLAQWVANGRYVLLLDGIDEVAQWQRERIAAWLQQAGADDTYALATSRQVGYRDWPVHCPFERLPVVGVSDPSEPAGAHLVPVESGCDDARIIYEQTRVVLDESRAWAQIRYLMPFDPPRVWDFIRKWYGQRSNSPQEATQQAHALSAALQKSSTTTVLARTPNLLGLMAVVFRERAWLPDGKAVLYREIANAYLNTIDLQRKIAVDDVLAGFGWEMREQWLAAVAFEMQLLRFEKWVENLRQQPSQTNGTDDSDSRAILATEAQVLQWLVEAMVKNNVPQAEVVARTFLDWVARRSGLLLPRGEGLYGFSHLSFQEYFAARFLMARFLSPAFIKGKLPKDAAVTPQTLREWARFATWEEVFVFLFELMSVERDQEWLTDLLEVALDESGVMHLFYIVPHASLMMRLASNRHVNLREHQVANLLGRCARLVLNPSNWDANSEAVQLLIEHQVLGYYDGAETQTDLQEWLHDAIAPPKCQALFIAHATCQALPSLSHLPNLSVLVLSMPQLKDLAGLAVARKIEFLEISGTQINELGALRGLVRLRSLHIDGTKVTDFAPLADLPALKELLAIDLRIKDFSALAHRKGLVIYTGGKIFRAPFK